MKSKKQLRKLVLIIYLMAVAFILLVDRALEPVSEWSAEELIFISDMDSIDASRGSNSVYRIRLDGSGMRRIVGSIRHADEFYLRISDVDCQRSSQLIAIASDRQDLDGFHLVKLDGGDLRQISGGAGQDLSAIRRIAIAPDGASVLLAREFSGFPQARYGLLSGDYQSGEYRTIKPPSASQSYPTGDWSPDGSEIAIVVERYNGDVAVEYVIAITSADGNGERIIYHTSLAIRDIDWSPDGEWIAAEIGGQIYKLRPDASETRRLSNHHAGVASPRWSPDSKAISYVAPSSYPQFHQLLLMDADGQNIRRAANIRGDVINACWV